jgi:hypothetical protein
MVTAGKQVEVFTKTKKERKGVRGSGISFADSDDLRFPSIQMNHPRSGKKNVSSIRSIRLVLEKIEKELMKVSTTRSKHDNIRKE